MADTRSGPQEPRLLDTFGRDAKVVWTEMRQGGVRRTLGRPFAELQEFYLTTHRRDRLAGMGRVKRLLFLGLWLLKALFLTLTPPRRLLLLLSFWLMWQGHVRLDAGGTHIDFDFPLLGIAVLLLILMLELKDKVLARNELEAGRAVQLALMPDRAPAFPGWDIWLFTRSANDVGGDLVDYLAIAPGRLGVTLGDVAGKALPAALLMAKLQSTIRALASDQMPLDELARRVSHILNRDGLPNRFATLVYAQLAADSGHVRLVNAGHMPPLLLRAGALEELPRGSIALGIVPDATFTEQQVDLAPGDALVVYSDGVTDAMNGAGDFFGDERLRAALTSGPASTAEQTGRRVLAAVDAFAGDARPFDDLSLVILTRRA
jgi:sigma-B regulation protein RsbU (phosphoserine phosphatase)